MRSLNLPGIITISTGKARKFFPSKQHPPYPRFPRHSLVPPVIKILFYVFSCGCSSAPTFSRSTFPRKRKGYGERTGNVQYGSRFEFRSPRPGSLPGHLTLEQILFGSTRKTCWIREIGRDGCDDRRVPPRMKSSFRAAGLAPAERRCSLSHKRASYAFIMQINLPFKEGKNLS